MQHKDARTRIRITVINLSNNKVIIASHFRRARAPLLFQELLPVLWGK